MLRIEKISKTFNRGTVNEKRALSNLTLHVKEGEFVTVIGSNGAGKSSLLNSIAGLYKVDKGKIYINNKDVTKLPEHKRAAYIGRVFQDPMLGTCAGLQIVENLALAMRRGERSGLAWSSKPKDQALFKERLAVLGLGLEDRLTSRVGLLSGGQRQALTLLMATLKRPDLLLLDEHTAALDPKTGQKVLDITEHLVADQALTTLMITHNMRDALRLGDRLIMLHNGEIIADIDKTVEKNLTVQDLLALFEKAGGQEAISDEMVLI